MSTINPGSSKKGRKRGLLGLSRLAREALPEQPRPLADEDPTDCLPALGLVAATDAVTVAPPPREPADAAAPPAPPPAAPVASSAAAAGDDSVHRLAEQSRVPLGDSVLADRAAAARRLEEELHQRLARWLRLEDDLRARTAEVDHLRLELASERRNAGNSREQQQALEQEAKGRAAAAADKDRRLLEAEARADALTAELAEHRASRKRVDGKRTDQRELVERQERKKTALADKIHGLEKQLDDLADLAHAREVRLQELDQTLEKRNLELGTLLEDLAEVRRVGGELARERDGYLQTIDELQGQVRTKNKLVAVLSRGVGNVDEVAATVATLDAWVSNQVGVRMIESMDGSGAARYPLNKAVLTIGRSHDSDIRVGGKHTSRRHARILNEDNAVVIEDVGSANGILVNESVVARCVLHDGDVFDIGGWRFRFVDPASRTTVLPD